MTDSGERAALATVRSLGRAGMRVVVAGARPHALASRSRYTSQGIQVSSPLISPADFVNDVNVACRKLGVNVIVPISEPSLLALLDARAPASEPVIPWPSLDVFRAVCDKQHVLDIAPALGIRAPSQTVVPFGQLPDGLPFPVVLKPARSVATTEDGERLKLGVTYARDARELESALAKISSVGYPVLAQQRIVGPGVGIFVLRWNGRTIARFSHRRLREKPPSGGVSVYRESYPMDEDLFSRSVALLDRLDWSGVAMIEYKIDAASGAPYLMEINGRLWGSLQLAIDAGVDFPAMLVRLALGDQVVPCLDYQLGVRSRWWLGDVDQLLTRLRKPDRALALPPDAPGKGKALLDFLRLWLPGDRSEVFRVTDPAPALQELADWLRRR